MAPFNTLFGSFILAIPLLSVVAIPRNVGQGFSVHITPLEAVANEAHCGYSVWPHSCWRYCGQTGQWCWIQPTVYCEKDSDCDPKAPCSSSCGKGKKKGPGVDDDDSVTTDCARPAVKQVTVEKPVIDAVEPEEVEPEAVDPTDVSTSLANDAHCGYSVWPHSCWKYCGQTGQWCWIQPTVYCEKDGDCDSKAPCTSSCGKGKKTPHVGGIIVQLLIG